MTLADRMGVLRAAAVLFLALVAPLKPSLGHSIPDNRETADKTPAALPDVRALLQRQHLLPDARKDNGEMADKTLAALPDVRALLQRQQLLRDARKYEVCRKELAEIVDLSDLPPSTAEPKWTELEAQARKLGIATAFSDAKAVFDRNTRFLRKKDGFGVAIYSKTRRGSRRMFVIDLVNTRIASFQIQHARGNFQNEGRNRSSLGCFIGGVDIKNVAFSLHGFDGKLNSLACERRLQVHISQSRGASPSFGCLTLSRGSSQPYKAIAAALSGGGLMCAYDEGRVPDRR